MNTPPEPSQRKIICGGGHDVRLYTTLGTGPSFISCCTGTVDLQAACFLR